MNTIEFLRQFRISGYAIFDFIVSYAGIYLLSPLLSKVFLKLKVVVPKQNWLFLVLPISILAHLIVGVTTSMTEDFININGHYVLKIVIIALLILGVRGVKIVKKEK